ncbi:hypothetical protein DAPPUDRAFT_239864 [Daphnia pulex]|uniref:Uncharacterized protein n=1 Tax=Daphnia pulex TaxID=6669 RepID=E9GA93_DAPPU|nr:hypothetical protein DAPPUDRAFT_239864 [Daphnia pulex]|eukprot:EFX83747.1 hypothetical protein DAPPUDRAFT_239864 [Daphnia pulex]
MKASVLGLLLLSSIGSAIHTTFSAFGKAPSFDSHFQHSDLLQKAAKHGLEEVQHLMEFEKRLLSDGLTANEMKCPARRGVHRKREIKFEQ